MKKQTIIITTFNAIYFYIILSIVANILTAKVLFMLLAVFNLARYFYLINKEDEKH